MWHNFIKNIQNSYDWLDLILFDSKCVTKSQKKFEQIQMKIVRKSSWVWEFFKIIKFGCERRRRFTRWNRFVMCVKKRRRARERDLAFLGPCIAINKSVSSDKKNCIRKKDNDGDGVCTIATAPTSCFVERTHCLLSFFFHSFSVARSIFFFYFEIMIQQNCLNRIPNGQTGLYINEIDNKKKCLNFFRFQHEIAQGLYMPYKYKRYSKLGSFFFYKKFQVVPFFCHRRKKNRKYQTTNRFSREKMWFNSNVIIDKKREQHEWEWRVRTRYSEFVSIWRMIFI